jgi:hypothetical protein
MHDAFAVITRATVFVSGCMFSGYGEPPLKYTLLLGSLPELLCYFDSCKSCWMSMPRFTGHSRLHDTRSVVCGAVSGRATFV